MPNETRPPRQDRLLIKVIMPKQGTERKVTAGGTPPNEFLQRIGVQLGPKDLTVEAGAEAKLAVAAG